MRAYDINQPLIVIHIPKTAGTSTEQIFRGWFGDGFLRHYFDEVKSKMPEKYDLLKMHSREKPILLHGHFNKLRHFGIEDYYPEVSQFITVLRDPFEQLVSSYFYKRRVGSDWKDQSRIPLAGLRDYLLNTNPPMLNHFPGEVTMDNYKDIIETLFIEIGITEYLDESMRRIAKKLNLEYNPITLQRMNSSKRDQEVPYALREEFIEKNPLEFAVYRYVLEKYTLKSL